MTIGYTVGTIAELLALTPESREDRLALRVAEKNDWYQFDANAAIGLIPDDMPPQGRWVQDIAGSISNGAIIGGISHFCQNTGPATGVDGNPLVIGDRWYSPQKFTECSWNGTYWISSIITSILPEQASSAGSDLPITTFSASGTSAGAGTNVLTLRKRGDALGVFFHSYDCTIGCSSADATNYWTLNFYARRQTLNPTVLFSLTINSPVSASNLVSGSLNTFLSAGNTNSPGNNLAIRFYVLGTKIGAPANLTLNTGINYSLVY